MNVDVLKRYSEPISHEGEKQLKELKDLIEKARCAGINIKVDKDVIFEGKGGMTFSYRIPGRKVEVSCGCEKDREWYEIRVYKFGILRDKVQEIIGPDKVPVNNYKLVKEFFEDVPYVKINGEERKIVDPEAFSSLFLGIIENDLTPADLEDKYNVRSTKLMIVG